MKAVNLIPAELRRGDSSAGHSGGLVYVVLGSLAVLVVLMAAWAGLGKVTSERKAEAAVLQAEAVKLEARAGELAHYEAAAAAARDRVAKVRTLATSRFEWAHTFREVSRILPNEAWVTTMVGTVASTVGINGGSNPLRASEAAPALELAGCTRRQDSVAKLIAQLRAMDGVTRVALSSSEKNEQAASSNGAPPTGNDCRGGSERPQFNLVVFFRPTGQAAVAGGTAATGATPPGAAPTPAPAGGANGTATTPAPASGAPAPGATPPASGTTPSASGSGTSPTPSTSTGAAQ